MNRDQVDSIARAWIAMHSAPEDSAEYRANFWAFERIDELREDDPEACWLVIDTVRRMDSSDSILSNLAAGPLEDLLVFHGAQFIERIEKIASNDPQLRKLLAAIWQNEIDDHVWERVKKVAGT